LSYVLPLCRFFSVKMDVFEAEEIANRKYRTALENSHNFSTGIFECEARRLSLISLRKSGYHSSIVSGSRSVRSLSRAIGDITEEARQTVQELIKKYGAAASCEGNAEEIASTKLFLDGLLVTCDGEYKRAKRRASAVRIIDLWKWRAFSRLQSRPSYGYQLVQWVDQDIRPYLMAFEPIDHLSFWYETNGSFRVEVVLPARLHPYGRIKTSASETRLSSPFSLSSTQPDLFACAHFALATFFTAPAKDLRHMQWDREQKRSPSWIEKREIYLLMAHTLKNKKRRKVSLLEVWIPLLPPELCRIILTYFGRAPRKPWLYWRM
jgi:hypothetical protein